VTEWLTSFWSAVSWPPVLTTLVGSALLASTKTAREKRKLAALNPDMHNDERQVHGFDPETIAQFRRRRWRSPLRLK
jgi:hypothetical protein